MTSNDHMLNFLFFSCLDTFLFHNSFRKYEYCFSGLVLFSIISVGIYKIFYTFAEFLILYVILLTH